MYSITTKPQLPHVAIKAIYINCEYSAPPLLPISCRQSPIWQPLSLLEILHHYSMSFHLSFWPPGRYLPPSGWHTRTGVASDAFLSVFFILLVIMCIIMEQGRKGGRKEKARSRERNEDITTQTKWKQKAHIGPVPHRHSYSRPQGFEQREMLAICPNPKFLSE